MPAMKRQAKSPMKSAKKAKTVDEVGPKIKELADVLSNSECDVPGPSGNRSMLVGALPDALGDYSDVRHSYQSTVAKIIGEVLQGWVTKWEQKVADAKTGVDTTETDKVAAEESQTSAKTSLDGQKETVKACKDALKVASEAAKEAAGVLSEKKSDVADFDTGLQKTVTEKDNISMVYNQSFLVVKSSEEVSASEAKAHLKKIAATLKTIGEKNSSLLIAIAPALEKKPAERGQFDGMAIDGVETVFTSTIEKLSGEIASAETTKAAKEATAAEAKSAYDAADAKKQECAAALKASQETQAEKEKSLAAADKNVEATSKAANKAVKAAAHEQRGLDQAKGSLAAFQFLLERTTPPPPPPTPPEEEATEEQAPAEAAV